MMKEAAAQAPTWLPIDTAPKNGKWVLLWWPYVTDVPFTGYCVRGLWHSSGGETWRNTDPTHWMPLPEPPVRP